MFPVEGRALLRLQDRRCDVVSAAGVPVEQAGLIAAHRARADRRPCRWCSRSIRPASLRRDGSVGVTPISEVFPVKPAGPHCGINTRMVEGVRYAWCSRSTGRASLRLALDRRRPRLLRPASPGRTGRASSRQGQAASDRVFPDRVLPVDQAGPHCSQATGLTPATPGTFPIKQARSHFDLG